MAGLSRCLESADASAGFCAGHRKYVGEESSSDNWCRCSSPFVHRKGAGHGGRRTSLRSFGGTLEPLLSQRVMGSRLACSHAIPLREKK